MIPALSVVGLAVAPFPPAVMAVNMLHPALTDGTDSAMKPYGISIDLPANLVSQWIPGGSSTVPNNFVTLGAFTTAPDGTNTAQKIVESNVNGPHNLVSGIAYRNKFNSSIAEGIVKLRLATVVAAAERTRIALYLTDTLGFVATQSLYQGISGVKAVFDLQAGTVAVAATAFNNPAWIALPASISLVGTFAGNKFYLCTLDALTGFWQAGVGFIDSVGGTIPAGVPIMGKFYLDAGSGNAAENTSYAGNGTSGVFAWKSNCNQVSMWSLGHAFLEDFNNTSGIDISNTKQPGFNFYVDVTRMFTCPTASLTYGVGNDFDVSGSVLNMHVQDTSSAQMNGQPWMASVVNDGTPTGYIGQAFQPPFLMEFRASWAYPPPGGHAGQAPLGGWSSAAEALFAPIGGPWPLIDTVEPDFSEADPTTGKPNWVTHFWSPNVALTGHKTQSIVAYPQNTTPDFSQFHTISNLIVPQATGTPPSSGSRNILPNSSFAGAVGGSPGTLPNNMSIVGSIAGVSMDVFSIAAGKLQMRIHGTSAGGGLLQLYFNSLPSFSSGGGTIGPGQIWSQSVSIRLAAGPDVLEYHLFYEEITAAGSNAGQLNYTKVLVQPTPTSLRRISNSIMINGTNCRRLGMSIQIGVPSGAVDTTFELFQPQLELSAMPTTFQNSFSTGDPAPVLGVAAVDAEPFFHRNSVFFDGLHCYDYTFSSLTNLGGFDNFLISNTGDSLHYPLILTCSNHTWPSAYDWVSVYTR